MMDIDGNITIFGQRLTGLREEKKQQQKFVAAELSLKPQVLAYYEKGKRSPDFGTLSKLANYYGVSVDYLIGNTDIRSYEDYHIIRMLDLEHQILSIAEQKILKVLLKCQSFKNALNSIIDYINSPPDDPNMPGYILAKAHYGDSVNKGILAQQVHKYLDTCLKQIGDALKESEV